MTGCAMKSEAIGADRIKTEGRQSIHRWRMSKIPPIVNGAEDNVGCADDEEIMVRQANPVNLAAAVHDHISCTKSAELRKVPETKDGRVNLPLTDHMYANYSEKPKGLGGIITTVSPIPPDIKDHVRCLEEILLSQLNLIGKQNETICNYEKKIEALGKELNESVRWDQNFRYDLTCSQSGEFITKQDWRSSVLSKRVGDCDDRMCIVKTENSDNGSIESMPEVGNSVSDAVPQPSIPFPTEEKRLLTKCCGRSNSKHPSRALKRRNIVLPEKSSKRPVPYLASSKPSSISSLLHVKKDDDKSIETNTIITTKPQPVSVQPVVVNFKKPHRKRGRKPRISTWKDDFLHTDKPYFLPDYYADSSPLANAETTIEVPSWRLLVHQRCFQIERTENIDDHVFDRRHTKYEKEEMKRKKRDLQQQRDEMHATEKLLRKKFQGKTKDSQGKLRRRSEKRKSISLYPSLKDIQYIEVTDSLPVIAFGHLIPVFQPSEFSLPWSLADSVETVESLGKFKQNRSSSCGQKVT